MNQYQNTEFQNQNDYQAPVLKKKAADFRADARRALKPCYWYAVLACLIASLLGAVTLGGSLEFDSSSSNEEYEGDVSVDFSQIYEVYEANGISGIFEEYPVTFLIAVIGAVAVVTGILFSLLVSSPVKLGYQRYNLNVIDGDGKTVGTLFRYFKQGYLKSIGLNVLYGAISFLCTLPLWAAIWFFIDCVFYALSQSFAAPDADVLQAMAGLALSATTAMLILLSLAVLFAAAVLSAVLSVVVLYRFYFCYMIMAEYPELGVMDALRNSAHLMRGNKWRLFCLQFSFIGWDILAGLAFGIGEYFLMPYKQAAYAAFYNEIANRQAAQDVEFPSLNPEDYFVEQ